MALSTSLNLSRNHRPDVRSRTSTATMSAYVRPRRTVSVASARALSTAIAERPITPIGWKGSSKETPGASCCYGSDVENALRAEYGSRAWPCVGLPEQLACLVHPLRRAHPPPSADVAVARALPSDLRVVDGDSAGRAARSECREAVVASVVKPLHRIVPEHRCRTRELRPCGLRCIGPDREPDQDRKQGDQLDDRPDGRLGVA